MHRLTLAALALLLWTATAHAQAPGLKVLGGGGGGGVTSAQVGCTATPAAGAATLSAAITSATAGDRICLQEGTYTETALITISVDNLHIICPTPATIIQRVTAATNLFTVDAHGFRLEGCTIDGSDENDGYAVLANKTTGNDNIFIVNNTFQNWGTNSLEGAVNFKGGDTIVVENNRFLDMIDVVIKGTGQATVHNWRFSVSDNFIRANYNLGIQAIHITQATTGNWKGGGVIARNTIDVSQSGCIRTSQSSGTGPIGLSIIDNICSNTQGASIGQLAAYRSTGFWYSVFRGNKWLKSSNGSGGAGLDMGDCSGSVIDGNIFEEVTTSPVVKLVDNVIGTVLDGCIFSNNYLKNVAAPQTLVIQASAAHTTQWMISNNILVVGDADKAIYVICSVASSAKTCSQVSILGNLIYGAGGASTGLHIDTLGADEVIDTWLIANNMFFNVATGISVTSDADITNLKFGDNHFKTVTTPYSIGALVSGTILTDSIPFHITAGSGTGVTVNYAAVRNHLTYKVSVLSTNCIANAVTCDLTIATLPAKTFIVRVFADLTTQYACTAVCTSSTLSGTLGTSAGGAELLASFDLDAATAQFGDADAELGTLLTAAARSANGALFPSVLASWSGTTTLTYRITSGTGNLGNGSATNLSGGAITFYIETVVYP